MHPIFSHSLRAQSVLLDGFKRVFLKSLEKSIRGKSISFEGFKQQLRDHREILLMSQEYLVPLLIVHVCDDDMSPFLNEILDFFKEEKLCLKDHIQKLLRHMVLNEEFMDKRLKDLCVLIKEDERGVYFPFCYLLPPKESLILKKLLLEEVGGFPPMRSDFKNGLYRNLQALMRTVMRWKVGSYLKKLKEHEERVLAKREKLETSSQQVSSFQDLVKILSPTFPDIPTEDELKDNIRVNGRSVSFIINGEEYILKVRKKNEDMYDHAEIACGLDIQGSDIQDNYGAVFYGHMGEDVKNFVHRLICDKGKNPRISLKECDLTEKAVLFKVKHAHYFDYLSDPDIPFDIFKSGLKKTMEQAFRFMTEDGLFMETLSDIAHDECRPGIFLPMIYFLDYMNGIFLGTFLNLIDSFKTVDACSEGVRDLGNALRILIKKNMAFSKTYQTYLMELYDQMKKDGEEKDVDEMILIDNMQEALAHTMMTASLLFFIRLSDHPEELWPMTPEQFVENLEEVLIEPFVRICGCEGGLETLRPFYQDMLKKDFEDFKLFPQHFEQTSSVFRQGDLSRNNYYQSFYKLIYFLISSMAPFEEEEPMDVGESYLGKEICSLLSHSSDTDAMDVESEEGRGDGVDDLHNQEEEGVCDVRYMDVVDAIRRIDLKYDFSVFESA